MSTQFKRTPIPLDIRKAVIERDKRTCYLCGGKTTAANRQIEHVVPVSEGGTNDISNLRVSDKTCNRLKGNTPLDQYVKKRIERLERELLTLRGLAA